MKIFSKNPKHRFSAGYTLMELLTSSILLVLILTSAASILITNLNVAARIKIWQDTRAEGTFAMSQLILLIRNSIRILDNTCENTNLNSIIVDNTDETKSKIEVDINSSRLKITTLLDTETNWGASSDIKWLTSESVKVDNLVFNCNQAGEQPYVLITFNVSRDSLAVPSITHTFSRAVLLRNF